MRTTLEDCTIDGVQIRRGYRLMSADWVPVTGEAVDSDAPPLLIVRPAGAINLLMPTSSADTKGLTFHIVNASANAVTLQTAAGAGFTTAIVLAANETTIVFCTGNASQPLGWQAVGTASSA